MYFHKKANDKNRLHHSFPCNRRGGAVPLNPFSSSTFLALNTDQINQTKQINETHPPFHIEEEKMAKLTLEYWQDEGWYVGRLVEVPGVFSQGETLDELKENIQDAYKLMLDTEPIDFIPAQKNRIAVELMS